jgi:hypothetical protein
MAELDILRERVTAMVHEAKREMEQRNLEKRLKAFADCMVPALHLLPSTIVSDLTESGFFTAPASTKYHGAYAGGLFDHSLNVTKALLVLTENNGLKWLRPESPYIVGMFHDICKQDQYRHPEVASHYEGADRIPHYDWRKWEHDSQILLKGHGDKSVMLLSQYVQLTMEEILCIRYHMGAFVDQNEWSDYTRAIHQYETVLWTHHADMIAAHIIEKEG